ncbi:MAG: N-acetylneuraminate synthase family protein [Candidatus Izemoplasmatales bacterium]|nr:N-acetylneuraminate synthase family protein [Candidatus Izemoplasmatales bacterium]
MREITIGNTKIGDGHPCYLIAEIGLNHNGRLDLAKKLVDVAADSGYNAVKTQRRNLETLYRPGILDETETADKGVQYVMPYLKNFQLSDRDLAKLKEYAESKGLDFLCTPFDFESYEYLVNELGINAIKIASADLPNLPLLARYTGKKIPMIISTGMSTEEEIENTYRFLKEKAVDFAFLHCNSNYPAPAQQINLNYMLKMKELFDIPIGYSGHELGIAVSIAAAALGADIVERHITLDRTMEGPDHAASLEPTGTKKLARDIRCIETAMGRRERSLSRGEVMNRQALGKSLVAARDIAAGETLTEKDLMTMSPGDGLSPQKYKDIIDKTINRAMKRGDIFLASDISGTSGGFCSDVSFKYGVIARWHDIKFLLDHFKPTILEVHMTADDMNHRPDIKEQVAPELVVHMPEHYGNSLLDICSRDEEHRKWSVERVREAARLTLEVAPLFKNTPAKPKMVVHPGAMSVDSFLPVSEIQKFKDQARRSLDELEGLEVEMMLENIAPFPWYLGGQWFTNYSVSADDMIELVKGRDYGITFDTSHMQLYCNWKGLDIVEEFKKAKPVIRHIHVADASGIDGEGLQIGMGNLPWDRLAPEMFGCGIVIMPEIWLGHLHGMAGMNEALFKLQQMWENMNAVKKS